jgi:hypothetical protein
LKRIAAVALGCGGAVRSWIIRSSVRLILLRRAYDIVPGRRNYTVFLETTLGFGPQGGPNVASAPPGTASSPPL